MLLAHHTSPNLKGLKFLNTFLTKAGKIIYGFTDIIPLMSAEQESQLKPSVVVEKNDDEQSIEVGVDVDGDKKPDFKFKMYFKDPRLWAAIGWIVAAISIAKNFNAW